MQKKGTPTRQWNLICATLCSHLSNSWGIVYILLCVENYLYTVQCSRSNASRFKDSWSQAYYNRTSLISELKSIIFNCCFNLATVNIAWRCELCDFAVFCDTCFLMSDFSHSCYLLWVSPSWWCVAVNNSSSRSKGSTQHAASISARRRLLCRHTALRIRTEP